MSVQKNVKQVVNEEVVVSDPLVQETVTMPLSEDQIRAKVAAEFELKFALLEARLTELSEAKKSEPKVASNNYNFGINPFEKTQEKGDTLVHMVEDGFTVGSVVYYRGQEVLLPAIQANLNGREQTLAYGKRYFRLGPWDGDSYDLDDPNLTEAERLKLAAIVAAQASR